MQLWPSSQIASRPKCVYNSSENVLLYYMICFRFREVRTGRKSKINPFDYYDETKGGMCKVCKFIIKKGWLTKQFQPSYKNLIEIFPLKVTSRCTSKRSTGVTTRTIRTRTNTSAISAKKQSQHLSKNIEKILFQVSSEFKLANFSFQDLAKAQENNSQIDQRLQVQKVWSSRPDSVQDEGTSMHRSVNEPDLRHR